MSLCLSAQHRPYYQHPLVQVVDALGGEVVAQIGLRTTKVFGGEHPEKGCDAAKIIILVPDDEVDVDYLCLLAHFCLLLLFTVPYNEYVECFTCCCSFLKAHSSLHREE